MAREGLAADPISLPPHALRPYLDFARLSSNALRAIARAVERDDEFRTRVVDAVEEAQVGRAGWLWLARPEGWEDELATIEAERGIQEAEAQQEKDERAATKRLAAAQAAAAEAEAEATERRKEALVLRSELAEEHRLRGEAIARLADAEAEVARLVGARTEVVRKLKEVESRLVERSTELNAVKARLREVEAELRARRTADSDPAAAPPPAETTPDAAPAAATPGVAAAADRRVEGPVGDEPTTASAPGGAEPARSPRAGLDGGQRDELIRQVGRAAGGAADLADALAAVMSLLDGAVPTPRGDEGATASPGAAPSPGSAAGAAGAEDGAADADADADAAPPRSSATGGPGGRRGRTAGPERVPIRLPGGIFDDSVEAAGHLLRAPGALLVVDGYNVSMTGWPDLSVADQRRKLVAALAELAARTSTPTDVVFDGADVGPVPVPGAVRSLVHTQFSPPGVEADDVILDLVAQLPPTRPVVVASSDNRVRAGAKRQGANVVHAQQLVELLPRR